MEGHLEALLEMDFCTKPPNFGVEAHMEAPTGDALTSISNVIFAVTPCQHGVRLFRTPTVLQQILCTVKYT
jgi:hypothetical protein